MKLLSKNELINRYEWKDYHEKAPEISGHPDDTLFDPKDGHQVLYMINKFAEQCNFCWVVSGLVVEKLLGNAIPSNSLNQIQVMAWLDENWQKEE